MEGDRIVGGQSQDQKLNQYKLLLLIDFHVALNMGGSYAVLTARVGGWAGAPSPCVYCHGQQTGVPTCDQTLTSYRIKPRFSSIT